MEMSADVASEPWAGFDDSVSVWMALITERERLKRIVETKRVDEPMFGSVRSSTLLTDVEVAGVEKKLARVAALVDLAIERQRQLGAVFAGAVL